MSTMNKLGACICNVLRWTSFNKRATIFSLLLFSIVANAQQKSSIYFPSFCQVVSVRNVPRETIEVTRNTYFYLFLTVLMISSFLICYVIYTRRRNQKSIQRLNVKITQLKGHITRKNRVTHSGSSLSDKKALKLIKELKALEKKELFLRSDYTLQKVAKRLNTNSTYLSETVNKYLEMTFVEYSNKLRIKSIVSKLDQQKQYRKYTIEALAKESGYKSVNSFNYHFKKVVNITPSQYLKTLSEKTWS